MWLALGFVFYTVLIHGVDFLLKGDSYGLGVRTTALRRVVSLPRVIELNGDAQKAAEILKARFGGKAPVIILDIDNTFTEKDPQKNDLRKWREDPLKERKLEIIYQMLSLTKLVFESGNSRVVQTKRLIGPLENYIKTRGLNMEVLENLTVYFNGGALKISYDEYGNSSLRIAGISEDSPGEIKNDKWYDEHNKNAEISPKETNDILEAINEIFQSGYVYQLLVKKAREAGFDPNKVIQAWQEYYRTQFQERFRTRGFSSEKWDASWLTGGERSFNLRILNSDYIEIDGMPERINSGRPITFPWFELRDGVQITVKLLPKEVDGVDGTKISIDIRGEIIDELNKKLASEGYIFNLKQKGVRPLLKSA